uniref:6-cysteine protein n=1 Tax=Parastrongyloides trichosuri TaxID=131310 RepID=A0A0N4ZQP9_PARTI
MNFLFILIFFLLFSPNHCKYCFLCREKIKSQNNTICKSKNVSLSKNIIDEIIERSEKTKLYHINPVNGDAKLISCEDYRCTNNYRKMRKSFFSGEIKDFSIPFYLFKMKKYFSIVCHGVRNETKLQEIKVDISYPSENSFTIQNESSKFKYKSKNNDIICSNTNYCDNEEDSSSVVKKSFCHDYKKYLFVVRRKNKYNIFQTDIIYSFDELNKYEMYYGDDIHFYNYNQNKRLESKCKSQTFQPNATTRIVRNGYYTINPSSINSHLFYVLIDEQLKNEIKINCEIKVNESESELQNFYSKKFTTKFTRIKYLSYTPVGESLKISPYIYGLYECSLYFIGNQTLVNNFHIIKREQYELLPKLPDDQDLYIFFEKEKHVLLKCKLLLKNYVQLKHMEIEIGGKLYSYSMKEHLKLFNDIDHERTFKPLPFMIKNVERVTTRCEYESYFGKFYRITIYGEIQENINHKGFVMRNLWVMCILGLLFTVTVTVTILFFKYKSKPVLLRRNFDTTTNLCTEN